MSKIDEGYIKYQCHWDQNSIVLDSYSIDIINKIRTRLVGWNMIGKIPDGPGFGNISIRNCGNSFFISGTNTGHLQTLVPRDIALVSKVDILQNTVWCTGNTQASSESMSHYAIYEQDSEVNAIIHIHHKAMWEQLINKMPTTANDIPYGTPQMAYAIQKEMKTMGAKDLLVLGGHEDGIVSFGATLNDAMEKIESLFQLISKK